MADKVSMNEAQLRDKVYKMVCESFEALMAEGKTFKDQKSWSNKGFQKQNKFQKTEKYKDWKNGGNMSSDQDECMNESVEEGVDEKFGDRLRSAVGNTLGMYQRGNPENWNMLQRGQDRLRAMGQAADSRLMFNDLENLMQKYPELKQYVQVDWNAVNRAKQAPKPYGY